MVTRLGAASAALVCLAAAGLSACTETGEAVPATNSPVVSTTVIPSVGPTTAATPTPQAQMYSPLMLALSGRQGSDTYAVHVPQVTGGVAAVRDRFNSGMRTTLNDVLGPLSDTNVEDGSLIGDDRSRVTMTGPRVVAGVAIYTTYSEGAAHPNNYVATITINGDNAQPILLSDVFTDPAAAGQRLAAAVERIDPRAAPVNGDIDNFLNWVPTTSGMLVYVQVVHALGDYLPVTVPWGQISDLMTPGMRAVMIG